MVAVAVLLLLLLLLPLQMLLLQLLLLDLQLFTSLLKTQFHTKKQKKSASAVSTTAAAPISAWASGEQKKLLQKDGSSDAASTSAPVPVAHPARSSDNDSRGQTSRSCPPSSLFESLVLTAPVMLSGQLQKGSSRFFEWPMRSVSVAHGVLSYSKQINGSSVFVDIPLNGRRVPPLTPRRGVMQPASPCLPSPHSC